MKKDPKNIVRIYLVSITRTDYDKHICLDPEYIHAFTNVDNAIELIQKELIKEKEYVESNHMHIEEICMDDDNQHVYMYGKDSDNKSFYFSADVIGSVPIVFNYENDWKSFRMPDIHQYTVPENQILPDTLYIVNQYMSVTGGCMPDLPDSAYITIDDAIRRVDELFQDTKESWEQHFADEYEIKYESAATPYAKEIIPDVPHFYYKVYVAGCSVPLN